jgi:hypothetical protein
MDGKSEKFTLPENFYNEMLKFFRRASLPRIQRQMFNRAYCVRTSRLESR